jgi:hypothetical protein
MYCISEFKLKREIPIPNSKTSTESEYKYKLLFDKLDFIISNVCLNMNDIKVE